MASIKKLTKIGNSYGLILPKEILETVGIQPQKGCLISVENNRLTVEPVRRSKDLDHEVAEAMLRFMKRYRFDLQKLASS